MDLSTIICSALSAGGSGGLVGGILYLVIRHWLAADRLERQQLRDKVDRLENEKILELRKRLDRHLEQDNPGAMAVEIRNIAAQNEKVSNKLDKISGEVSALNARFDGLEGYVRNIDRSHRELRKEVYNGK